jgi:phospholipase C
VGSDAEGLVMGHYDTRQLPIYDYLHSAVAPPYAIADSFFQGAFGGSYLNHQWLIAAATPTWPSAVADGGAMICTPWLARTASRLARRCTQPRRALKMQRSLRRPTLTVLAR